MVLWWLLVHQPLNPMGFQWFSLVAYHWPNDGMVTLHCYGLACGLCPSWWWGTVIKLPQKICWTKNDRASGIKTSDISIVKWPLHKILFCYWLLACNEHQIGQSLSGSNQIYLNIDTQQNGHLSIMLIYNHDIEFNSFETISPFRMWCIFKTWQKQWKCE